MTTKGHKRARAGRNRFRDFMGSGSVVLKRLPLIHTTPAYHFADIYPGDELIPEFDRLFQEPVLYLFYGRPSYRMRGIANTGLEFNWPIIFVFHPERINHILRVFPFDTGAFQLGLYKDFFSHNSPVRDFELDGALDSAARLVHRFYGDNESYYVGSATKNVDIPFMQFEAEGVQAMSRLPGVQLGGKRRDERSSTIEIQVGTAVRLQEALLAIIIPQQYLQQKEVVLALDRWNVRERRYYEVLHNTGSEVWIGQIYSIVADLYRALGYLP